ncbi:MAG: LysM peptidoglycan-binding domain-containing protein [Geobacteraceae bacterium]|nr:LysM peptidoglycan-binding domain-containing protein [Geobacteraceae bacterium]
MKTIFQLNLCCLILCLVTACVAPVSIYRGEAALAFERVSLSKAETLFPNEVRDFYQTVNRGDTDFLKGDMKQADLYYSLALGKGQIVEKLYLDELKRREEAARRELEMKRQAEAELVLQKKNEQEKAEEVAIEAALKAKRLEAEKAEARKRAERAKQEKEIQLVSRHTVKRGETLPQIAALPEVFGDSSLWPLIYRANRDQIGNPAVLWPGQDLRIPRNSERSDISEARRFAAERPIR